MRVSLAALPILVLCACEANVDQGNDSVTLQYDQNLAEDAAGDIANGAQQIGGAIVNDVQETAEKVDNKVDVDVDINNEEQQPPANSQ
jgi:hypothetical protein